MNLLDEINKIVPQEIKDKIKELKVKFDAVPPVIEAPIVAPANLAAIETKLKDGKTLSVDKMEVGGKAQLISETGAVDAPDATYEAEDGTLITCAGGLITEIKKSEVAPVAPAPENDMPAMYAALEARLKTIETNFAATANENLALKTEMASLNSATKVTLSAVNSILSTPAGNPIEKPVTKSNLKSSTLMGIGDNLNKK